MRNSVSILMVSAALLSTGAYAVESPRDGSFQSSNRLLEQGGEAIFTHVCAACHMPDAKGAIGAGRYPALAENRKLATASYPVFMVTNGRAGMPAFSRYLDDDQIANVVNYVRTHFGNTYSDMVTPADVKLVRSK
jgi:mono/diheme cytochrome c family protein